MNTQKRDTCVKSKLQMAPKSPIDKSAKRTEIKRLIKEGLQKPDKVLLNTPEGSYYLLPAFPKYPLVICLIKVTPENQDVKQPETISFKKKVRHNPLVPVDEKAEEEEVPPQEMVDEKAEEVVEEPIPEPPREHKCHVPSCKVYAYRTVGDHQFCGNHVHLSYETVSYHEAEIKASNTTDHLAAVHMLHFAVRKRLEVYGEYNDVVKEMTHEISDQIHQYFLTVLRYGHAVTEKMPMDQFRDFDVWGTGICNRIKDLFRMTNDRGHTGAILFVFEDLIDKARTYFRGLEKK